MTVLCFVSCSSVMTPVVGRRKPLSRIGVHSRVMLLDQTLLLEPSSCVFSLVPLDYVAVIDPKASRWLINSVAANVFLSGLF